jgi:MYXO-CTERM domain-containing protein
MRSFGLLALALVTGFAGRANATLTATSSIYFPFVFPGTTTELDLQSVASAPSQTAVTGLGYGITFDGIAANQGLVQGASFSFYAIPVAGFAGTFLAGDYGSAQTTDAAAAGKYLSTGTDGSIVISFDADQLSLSLLWGSIDATNELDFYKGATFLGALTGTQLQASTDGFVSDGFQGFGGSAFVAVDSSQPFDKLVARSSVLSFELAGVAASTSSLNFADPPPALPEPPSIALAAVSLLGLALIRRRRPPVARRAHAVQICPVKRA